MAKTNAERIEERRQRIAEYNNIRKVLLEVIADDDAGYRDKISAINALYKLDKEGTPMPSGW